MQRTTQKITNIMLALVVGGVLFGSLTTQAQEEGDTRYDRKYDWIGGDTGNSWSTAENWQTPVEEYDGTEWVFSHYENIVPQPLASYSHGDNAYISTGDLVVVNNTPPSSNFVTVLDGTLEIRAPFTQNRASRPFFANSGSILNQYDDFTTGERGFRLDVAAEGEANNAVLNVHAGNFTTTTLDVLGGNAEVNAYGGQINSEAGLDLMTDTDGSATFNVAGSGTSQIVFQTGVSGQDSDGIGWDQSGGGTLKLGIDSGIGGVTTTDVTGDVMFGTGALLDVSFLDGYEEYGTAWRVMEWDGSLLDGSGNNLFTQAGSTHLTLDDVPLSFVSGIDLDKWNVDFYQTNSGYMEITAVPEPGSLALLLIGAACLFTGRRRRRK